MTISHLDEVVILYNPISTGNSKANAEELADQLRHLSKKLKVSLKETEYAGHAEILGVQYAKRKQITLLVSSSGDGSYNELINGVLSSGADNVLTAVLPSGNANDHHRAVSSGALVQNIVSGKSRYIDVLRVTAKVNNKVWIRYAHSYAGIGLSPVIGRELTKEKLNFFNEKWLFLKHFLLYRYVAIRIKGKRVKYDSLVFSNVNEMSKIIKLSKNSSLTDGKFEVSAFRHRSKLLLLRKLFKAVTIGLEENSSVASYEFRTIKKLLVQLDGEDFTIDSSTHVKIESVHKALHIIA